MPTTDQIQQQEGGVLTDQTLGVIRTTLVNPQFASVNTPVLTGNAALSTQANITAHSGGGQANAVALVVGINQINTVAANGDSVRLPASTPGIAVVVMNNSANNANLFPAANEAINQGANNVAFNLPGNKTAEFYCPVAGTWASVLSA
jgi:hypothetical protein